MKRFSLSDWSVGIFFSLLGILIFLETRYFPLGEGNVPGPRYWPRLIAFGFIFLGLFLALKGIDSKRTSRVQANVRNIYQQKTLALLATTVLYIFLWSTFGFLLPTFLFLFAAIFIFRPLGTTRDIGILTKSLVVSAGITLFFYGCFYLGLHVPLN